MTTGGNTTSTGNKITTIWRQRCDKRREKMVTLSSFISLNFADLLKLPSLFAAWLFWTFHTKSHNMKALVILSHSWSPFLALTCSYGNQWTFVGLCGAFWSIFFRKNSPQITHANHMTMTTNGHILTWTDYHKTKVNVNITFLDLCLFTFYSVHTSESTWHLL